MLFDFSSQKWSEFLKMGVGFTDWSKDGKYIYFDIGLSEDPAVYRVRVADRKLERAADLKGLRRLVFAGAPWSGVTPTALRCCCATSAREKFTRWILKPHSDCVLPGNEKGRPQAARFANPKLYDVTPAPACGVAAAAVAAAASFRIR